MLRQMIRGVPGPGEIGCRSVWPPPLRGTANSPYTLYGIIKVGRNAASFLGNTAEEHRLRTALDSVHYIETEICISASRNLPPQGKAFVRPREEGLEQHDYKKQRMCLGPYMRSCYLIWGG